MFGFSAKSKATRELTFAVDDFVAGIKVAVGIAVENISNNAGKFGIAKVFGDLFVGGDLALGN